ncbi:14559_t:CDS:2 [Ambispora leptoticha]|uniref:14559_t:CDS:1 n=1 Tax=Ambispora leptoticha TaxID=144679 RepID=A0A9N9AN55_9GLOM|nr:14559_t:CDS:2 [Ambispora leptoticha]
MPGYPDFGQNDLIMTDGYGIFRIAEVRLIMMVQERDWLVFTGSHDSGDLCPGDSPICDLHAKTDFVISGPVRTRYSSL